MIAKLTREQLALQKFADKTIRFWSIIRSKAHQCYLIVTEIFDVSDDDIKSYKLWDPLPHGEPIFLRYKWLTGSYWLDDIEENVGVPMNYGRLCYVYNFLYKKASNEAHDMRRHVLIQEFFKNDNWKMYDENMLVRPDTTNRKIRKFLLLLPVDEFIW